MDVVQCALPGIGAVAAAGQSPGNTRCGGLRNHYVAASCPLEIIELPSTQRPNAKMSGQTMRVIVRR